MIRSASIIRHVYLFALVCLAVIRANATEDGDARPTLLMLMIDSPDIADIQVSFKDELKMALETHSLETISPFRFASENMTGRIEALRHISSERQAEAVIWLEPVDATTISLQVVVPGPGRSMARSVEAKISEDAVGELVIAAREILEELRISMAERQRPAAAETAPPGGSSEQPDPGNTEPPSPGRPSPGTALHVALELATSGGFGGFAKSPVLVGGAMSASMHSASGWFLAFSIAFSGVPGFSIDDGSFQSWGIRPGAAVGYLWTRGRLSLGPHLGLQAPWQTASASLRGHREITDSWWNFRMVPAMDIQMRLHRRILLSVRPGLGISVTRVVFRRQSDAAVIYKSPLIEWNGVFSLIIDVS